jgi:hypothetical protein
LAAFLKAPQAATAALGIEPSMLARLDHVAGRLEAAATKAESHTTATRMALDLAYASEGERKDVREALTDIAMSIGVLAGSIEPAATADNF